MYDSAFFSTEAITLPIGFRMFAIAQLRISGKYSAKWDRRLRRQPLESGQHVITLFRCCMYIRRIANDINSCKIAS